MAASVVGLGLMASAAAAQTNAVPMPPDPPTIVSPSPYAAAPRPVPSSPPSTKSEATLEFHREAVVPEGAAGLPNLAVPAEAAVQEKLPQLPAEKTYPKTSSDAAEFRSLREIPGLEVLTRVQSEAALKQQMRQELLRTNPNEKISFPEEPAVAKEPYSPRQMAPLTKLVEPYFVVHGRLLFEQPDFERGLWDLGIFGPIASNAKFAYDIAMLPYHLGTRPFQQYDTSASKCLPGDPTPLYIYPEELSLTGLAAEAAVVTGLFFIFP